MADSPEELRRKALETASIVEETLRSIADNITEAFTAAVAGTDRVSQTVAKDIQSRFNKLAKVTDDLASNAFKLQQGLLDVKKVQDQINERKTKELSLGTQLVTYLRRQGNAIGTINDLIEKQADGTLELTSLANGLDDEYKNLIKDYKLTLEYGEDFVKTLEEQKAAQDEINTKLGNTGKLVKGISKIPILGNLVDTNDVLKTMNQNIAEGGNRTSAMKAGFKNIGSQIKTSLTDPLTIVVFLVKQFVEAFKASDKATGELAKGFNITYSEANNLRSELGKIASSTDDINISTKGLQESIMAVGQALGSNAILNEKDLVFMTKMREMAGFTNEEIIGIEKTTLATGGNLENNVKNLMFAAKTTALNNKVLLNEKDIMRDVSKTSDAIKLSLGGSGKALGAAVSQAKALGLSLEQVDKIAESLLNFEQSISSELEAELLINKDLNLEQARLYALNNNMEGLSKELAKNFGTAAEFSKMNRIQQEAAAKAVGMSREELAKTLTDQAALKGLTGDQADKAKEALAAARARGMSEEEIASAGIDNLMKQQSIQERFNKSVEKLKEIFIGIADAVMPILDTLSSALNIIGYMVKPLTSIMGWANQFGPVIKTIVGLLVAAGAAALFMSGSLTLGIGVAAAMSAIGYGMTKLNEYTKVKPMRDGEIDYNNGPIVSGNFGSIQLSSKDTGFFNGERIIAGTNLGGKGNSNPQIIQQDLTPLLAEIRAMRQETARSNNKPVIVENSMDGTRFGTAVAMNTYKTQ